MNKISTILLALLLFVGVSAQAAQVLRLTDGSGQQTDFSLAGTTVFTVGAEELTVTNGTTMLSYSRDSYLKFEIIDDATAISAVTAGKGNVSFSLSGSTLSAEGLTSGETLSVYTVDGKRVASARANANGQATVSVNQKGQLLVVKAASRSFKFINK